MNLSLDHATIAMLALYSNQPTMTHPASYTLTKPLCHHYFAQLLLLPLMHWRKATITMKHGCQHDTEKRHGSYPLSQILHHTGLTKCSLDSKQPTTIHRGNFTLTTPLCHQYFAQLLLLPLMYLRQATIMMKRRCQHDTATRHGSYPVSLMQILWLWKQLIRISWESFVSNVPVNAGQINIHPDIMSQISQSSDHLMLGVLYEKQQSNNISAAANNLEAVTDLETGSTVASTIMSGCREKRRDARQ